MFLSFLNEVCTYYHDNGKHSSVDIGYDGNWNQGTEELDTCSHQRDQLQLQHEDQGLFYVCLDTWKKYVPKNKKLSM